jgi:glutamate/aspartate transport system substrate-binding protein
MGDWIQAGRALARSGPLRLCALILGFTLAASAAAQPAGPPVAPFTGTLQKIYERGVIRLGHRENSPPFAFLDAQRRPIGYALDICNVVVEEIAQHLHKPIQVEYVPVTPANRFDLVNSGAVDLECGSTTASAERRQLYGFSPTVFVTGTKLLVKRGSRVNSLRDLQGKTVVLTTGTIQADAIPRIAQRQKLAIRFEFAPDHDQSMQALATGRADAFANDDVQLYGAVAARNAAANYRVVGDFLTYADYALMFRRDDPEFEAVVRQAFDRVAGSGEIRAIYRKWFERPLPSGASLELPMSPHLEHVFRLQGLAAD